jgi:hypothetical protein
MSSFDTGDLCTTMKEETVNRIVATVTNYQEKFDSCFSSVDPGKVLSLKEATDDLVKAVYMLRDACIATSVSRSKSFNMDTYTRSKSDLPNELYRIDYPGSRTTFSSLGGFTAADTTKNFGTTGLTEFKRAVENQFNWRCREALPFISLFSDREHAETWGLKQPWRGNTRVEGNWTLYVIDVTKLISTNYFFKLSDLVEDLDLEILGSAGQHKRGAFLCLHRIPASAIVESRNPTEVKEGKFSITNLHGLASNRRQTKRDDGRNTMQETSSTI